MTNYSASAYLRNIYLLVGVAAICVAVVLGVKSSFYLSLLTYTALYSVAALGLFLLLPYRALWRAPLLKTQALSRRMLTTILAAIAWYAMVAGHLLNNLKGIGF